MIKYIKALHNKYKNYKRMKSYMRELKSGRLFRHYTFTIEDAIEEIKTKEQNKKKQN